MKKSDIIPLANFVRVAVEGKYGEFMLVRETRTVAEEIERLKLCGPGASAMLESSTDEGPDTGLRVEIDPTNPCDAHLQPVLFVKGNKRAVPTPEDVASALLQPDGAAGAALGG